MEVDGTVGLVTGGASGLGRATAAALVAAGARVVLGDLPSSDGQAVAAGLCRDREDAARFVAMDVTREDDVQAAVAAAVALEGPQVVVNCAGIATPGRVVGKRGVLPLEQFARVVTVNLVGTFNVCRLAAAALLERADDADPGAAPGRDAAGGGEERAVFVNTASVAAFDGQIGQAAYAASKGGVAAMTLPLARDLADARIRVCTIAPGIFATPMMAGLPQAAQDSLAQQVPHPRRLGRPEEYAALVLAIVGNPMLNGEVIRLDGALRMAPR